MMFLNSRTVQPELLNCRRLARLGAAWKLTWVARAYTQLTITGLRHDHLLAIPPHAKTNILWDLGHLTYSLDRMLYEPAGLKSPLPDYYAECFRPGITPALLDFMPDVDVVLAEFDAQLYRVQDDIKARKFKRYTPVALAKGVRLRSLDDALGFAAAHEGFHAGVISSLRDLVT